MATVTRPSTPLPDPGDEMDAEQVRDWINNILTFLESTNIDEANVDLTSLDGIMGKSTAQTIVGKKTFESTNAAAAGIVEVLELGLNPSSGTAADNDGGRVVLYADDDGGNPTDLVNLDWVLTDASNGSEDAEFRIRALKAGTMTEFLTAGSTLAGTGRVAVTGDIAVSEAGTFGGGYGATGVTISTAGVIQANGAITSDGAVTGATLAGTVSTAAQNSITSASSLATVGTITSGTWSGVIDASATMTMGSDATGDIYYRNASGFLTRLAAGADGTVLTGTGAGVIPAWESPTVGDITSVVAGVGLSGGGTTGDVTLTLDISELGTVTPANGDFFATLDSDGANEQKTTTTALATLFAGAGMTATSAVLNVIGGDGITANSGDVAITAAQTTVTSIYNASLKMGRDSQNLIDFATADDKIILRVANVNEVELVANTLQPTTSDGVALGTASLMWSDLFLASGSVVNFAAGDVTLTHSSETLTVAGGTFAAAAITGTTITGTGVVTGSGFTIGSAVIGEAELEILDGATVTTAELNLLDGLDRGSIIYGNASSVTTVLGQGGAGTVLTSDGTDISWAASTGGHTIEEEGTSLAQRTKLNFIGASVTVTDDSGDDATDVTIGATSVSMPFVKSDGSTSDPITLSVSAVGESLVTDTSPQLGGNLDVLARSITTTTTNGDIAITPHGTGKVVLDTNLTFDGTTLAVTGALTMANAAGPTIVNEAATATNPTLIPNKAEVDTGFGWAAADTLTVITGGTERMRIDNAGAVTMPTQPAFFAGTTNEIADVTGDATAYIIVFPTEQFDSGGDYNTSDGLFTAPVAGRYQFNVSVWVGGLTSSHTAAEMWLTTSDMPQIQFFYGNPYPINISGTNTGVMTGSCIIDMDAADTAKIVLTVAGGAKVVDVQGSGNATYSRSHFSGFLAT